MTQQLTPKKSPKKSNKKLLFISLTIGVLAIIAAFIFWPRPNKESTFLRDGVLVNSVSYDLFQNNIAVDAKVSIDSLKNYEGKSVSIEYFDIPKGVVFSDVTGYLILLTDSALKKNNKGVFENSKAVQNTIKVFQQNNYTAFKANDKMANAKFIPPADKVKIDSVSKYYTFLVPNIFLEKNYSKIDNYIDDKFADDLFDRAVEWEENYFEITDIKKENDSIEAQNANIQGILDGKNREIQELQNRLGDLTRRLGILSTNEEAVVEPEPKTIKLSYDKDNDYTIEVLKDHTVDIPKDMYDPKQASLPRADKELVDAWKELVTKEKEALKKIGAEKIKVISGSRTPLKQMEVRQSKANKITGKPFGTGHAYGNCVDFSMANTSYDVRPQQKGESDEAYSTRIKNNTPNYNALKSLMEKYGIEMPVKGDPNHATMASYSKDPKHLQRRIEMIKGYKGKIAEQREKQLKDLADGKDKNKKLKEANKALDELVKQADQQIEKLKKDIAKREQEIEQRNRERAQRERESRYRGRDRNGTRIEKESFTYSDRNRDCYGERTTVRDSRGDIISRESRAECRSKDNSREGGIRF